MRLLRRLRTWLPGSPSAEPPLSHAYPTWPAWQAMLERQRAQFDAQFRLQGEVGRAAGTDGWPGWCGLCSQPARFSLPSAAGGAEANLREEMVCAGCGLTARNRVALALLLEGQPRDSVRLYLTEQASAAYVWLQNLCPALQGSEYGLDATTRPRLQSWYRHLGGRGELVERDVTRLDFADDSLDAIGSFDVLEHVPDYAAALREFARCLRTGGRLVLTVPFADGRFDTLVRARLRPDGSVEHLLEPEIHGDPVAGGVLCYYHFGWDLLDTARQAGFSRAAWVRTWSPREGLFGMWTLVAER